MDGIFLDQQLYLTNLLSSAGITNVKPTKKPMEANMDLHSEEEVIDNPTEYRRIVGSM